MRVQWQEGSLEWNACELHSASNKSGEQVGGEGRPGGGSKEEEMGAGGWGAGGVCIGAR